ncbi:hypothetical protein J4Q44_G00002870 [Coregonus suidteri]|uniref:Target of rapamycin complex subunit lst8 n=1 Tax=Coregonus suidteri TaxID=861788 RepID=A0AAN8RA05_9TELE
MWGSKHALNDGSPLKGILYCFYIKCVITTHLEVTTYLHSSMNVNQVQGTRHLNQDSPAPGLSSELPRSYSRQKYDCSCRLSTHPRRGLHGSHLGPEAGDQSGVIHIWDLKTDHNEQLIPEPDVSINSVHIDPDASYMAAVNSSGNCYVWNLAGGIGDEAAGDLLGRPDVCQCYIPSCVLYYASSDNLARLWCVETGEIKREYSGHQKAVVGLVFNDSVLG